MTTITLYHGDAKAELQKMPDKSVHCCVTSPPYYGLRDYGVDGQIGLEETPELYVQKLVEVFREVKRVLRDDATLWLNLGDSYASGSKGTGGTHYADGTPYKQITNSGSRYSSKKFKHGLKDKDMIGIPWMVAFALRADGWYLRQDIIWAKPNPMPESVTDRCTKSHEYIFLLSKSKKYYYDADAIKQPFSDSTVGRLNQDIENQTGSERVPGKTNGNMKAVAKGLTFGGKKARDGQQNGGDPRNGHRSDKNSQWGKEWKPKGYSHRGEGDKKLTGHSGNYDANGNLIGGGFANKRSVWTVPTMPYKAAHFATFPEALIVDCIKAGSPEGGTVIDPFAGACTTLLVSHKLNRNSIGIELNEAYIEIGRKRLRDTLGMFTPQEMYNSSQPIVNLFLGSNT